MGLVEAGELAGAALLGGPEPVVVAWGDGVTRWPAEGGNGERFLKGRKFTAGCAGGDGTLFLLEDGRLSMFRAPYTNGVVLESDTGFQDCLPWMMDGRRGVLIPHRHLQLRFYREGASPKDLYSIYTPSKQGGLIARDVDLDGRDDLLWGNYWLQRPRAKQAHWRLFAINTFFETGESALARLAWSGQEGLFWGAAAGEPRLALMKPAADRKQLWKAETLPDPPSGITALLPLRGALAVAHAKGIALYERSRNGFMRRDLTASSAVALYERDGAVWAVFDSGPRVVYRLK
jgi:hypothetical protein